MIKAFLPAFVWLLVITKLSTMPGLQLPKFDLISMDKLAHAFVYAVFVVLAMWGFSRNSGQRPTFREGFISFAVAATYGAFMEWVQGTFFPGRFFEYDDMLANAFGAAVAWAAFTYFPKKKQLV
jgi:VanZ family protein